MKTRSHLHTLLAPALFLFAGWAQALEIQPYAANTLQQLQTQGNFPRASPKTSGSI